MDPKKKLKTIVSVAKTHFQEFFRIRYGDNGEIFFCCLSTGFIYEENNSKVKILFANMKRNTTVWLKSVKEGSGNPNEQHYVKIQIEVSGVWISINEIKSWFGMEITPKKLNFVYILLCVMFNYLIPLFQMCEHVNQFTRKKK
jgi:hypothetical protein